MARLQALAATSAEVAAKPGRLAKVARLADDLRALTPEEAALAACWLTGETGISPLGVGPALVAAARAEPPASRPTLDITRTAAHLSGLADIRGSGAQARRRAALAALFRAATRPEQDFLARLLLGELRQGALSGLMVDAIAKAARLPAGSVRRALMLTADLRLTTRTALTQGAAGLAGLGLRLFHPIQPMLAEPAADLDQALVRLDEAALEYKLDGARVQVHKSGAEVRVFTRQGNEVTGSVPEIVEAVAALPVAELVLDGETLALGPDGRPLPFQVSMRRFGRRLDVAALRGELPLSVYFFDCIQHGGRLLIDAPARERFAALADAVPAGLVVPRLVPKCAAEAQAFLDQALAAGHEGLMAKALGAPYQAGGRGGNWLKIKQAQTLDLVVLAAEWGSGRRSGWLSNLHLGAPDGEGGFVMLGKTVKGLTDTMLDWQTRRLRELAVAADDHLVQVRPELVVEIAFNELQASPHYPGGLALRFARVKRYRNDKTADQADGLDTVRALFDRQVAYRAQMDP
jgi:DNA ligase-1